MVVRSSSSLASLMTSLSAPFVNRRGVHARIPAMPASRDGIKSNTYESESSSTFDSTSFECLYRILERSHPCQGTPHRRPHATSSVLFAPVTCTRTDNTIDSVACTELSQSLPLAGVQGGLEIGLQLGVGREMVGRWSLMEDDRVGVVSKECKVITGTSIRDDES
ncbi:hypothetical protein K0M31_018335 [Melipona bicolor]|uniref:Uncharacterized protein n=1 Tax=Melipona bicolor TaxID=60889 RepID=A0AA40KRL8_9HYME|nr:hypothetical protein K0M31_018335 [Melipona bicolor]